MTKDEELCKAVSQALGQVSTTMIKYGVDFEIANEMNQKRFPESYDRLEKLNKKTK